MIDSTIIHADCGCQFKATTTLPLFDTGTLVLVKPCASHRQARTVGLAEQLDRSRLA